MRGDQGSQDRGKRHQDKENEGDLAAHPHVLETAELHALGSGFLELGSLLFTNLNHGLHRPNARVDEQIQHVDHDVDDDEGQGHDDDDALDEPSSRHR